ncbi:MAG: hypothetical protein JXB40_00530 [Candidatus Omnitrophica bacterium]|nr:hypothetical protein [Candidatus Omnitrophota bacterium]
MAKKIKITLILLGVYLIVFWIGFKAGTIYLRMQNKVRIERIQVPVPHPEPPVVKYFVLRKYNNGSYSDFNITEIGSGDVIMKVYNNEKLRPLLESLNIEIYDKEGDRIY